MLTRFFSHSKPIAYAITVVVFAIAFVIENFFSNSEEVNTTFTFKKLMTFVVFLLILFLLNFILKRNKIHGSNTYAISTLTLLLIAFPEVLRSYNFAFGYFFLLLAVRRILSLKTNTAVKQKLLDAGLLLSVSMMFEPLHVLFLGFIFLSVMMYVGYNFRHFIIPFVGVLIGYYVFASFSYIVHNEWIPLLDFLPEFDGFDLIVNQFKYNILLIFIAALIIWIIIQLTKIYSKAKLHQSESLNLIIVFWIISVLVLLLSATTWSVGALYILLPLSIFIGSYFQLKTTKTWVKEVFYLLMIAGIIYSAIY